MDSSNRLGIVLGVQKVDASELQLSEWISIVNFVLGLCRPELKYFPGFKPLAAHLNCLSSSGAGMRKTALDLVSFPPGLSEKTRCWVIDRIDSHLGKPNDKLLETNLLLTTRGHLVLWDAQYWIQEHTEDRGVVKAYVYAVTEHAEFSNFYWQTIAEAISVDSRLAARVLGFLYRRSQEGIGERKVRLSRMEGVGIRLRDIIARIDNLN